MHRLTERVKTFIREEDSPSMVEYALLMAFIALVVAFSAEHLGRHVRNTFKEVKDVLEPFIDD